MKVKALLLCLALVPLVLAQSEPANEEEPDTMLDNFWSMVSNFFSGNRDRLTNRMQKGINLVNQGLTVLGEAVDEYSIEVETPDPKIPDAEQIIANITSKVLELKTWTEQAVEEIKQKAASFDLYDHMDNEPESDPENEPTPTPEVHEEEQAEISWWPW